MLGWYYVIWFMYVDNEGCRCWQGVHDIMKPYFQPFWTLVFSNGHEKHPFGYVMDFEIYLTFITHNEEF
jgi:hypothetical protein